MVRCCSSFVLSAQQTYPTKSHNHYSLPQQSFTAATAAQYPLVKLDPQSPNSLLHCIVSDLSPCSCDRPSICRFYHWHGTDSEEQSLMGELIRGDWEAINPALRDSSKKARVSHVIDYGTGVKGIDTSARKLRWCAPSWQNDCKRYRSLNAKKVMWGKKELENLVNNWDGWDH